MLRVRPESGRAVGVLSNLDGAAGVMLEVERRLIEEITGPVYAPPPGESADVALDAYVGGYEVPPDPFRIALRDGHLWLTKVRIVTPNWGVLEGASPWPTIVPFELGSDGRAEWVTIGGRAARRVRVVPGE